MSTAAKIRRNGRPSIRPLIQFPEDRLPPQNLEAEQGVIAGMIKDNTHIAAVRMILRPEDFYRENHGILCRAIFEQDAAGNPVEPIGLLDELKRRELYDKIDGDDGLATILDSVPHAANTTFYAGIVREKATKRRIIEALNRALQDGYADAMTAAEMLERSGRELERIRRETPGDEDDGLVLDDWPTLGPAAYHGPAGSLVRMIEPHTEADPVGVLIQFLVGFGNLIGRGPHFKVSATAHYLNLNVALVGPTASGRKGTSWDCVSEVLRRIDDEWQGSRELGGLTSGEGLIHHVRDETRDKNGGIIDPGVEDKRLLVIETELSSVFKCMNREGNTLSDTLRKAWDCKPKLQTMGKNNPSRSTGAHISIIGHITRADVLDQMKAVDQANGFGNRFLWACVRRSKFLPEGGDLDTIDWNQIVLRLGNVAAFARDVGKMTRDADARELWHAVYPELSTGKPGLLGAILGRAEAQVMRLACLYALLDYRDVIGAEHLTAALALWRYCEASVRFIFGASLGTPDADKLLTKLREASDGLSRTQVTVDVFGGNKTRAQIDNILSELVAQNLIHHRNIPRPGGGRGTERWYAGKAPV